jgi:formiminotetrahydrofolate cyclodeaminase
LTQRKADWGLSHHSIEQTNQLEDKVRQYFHQGCSNSQIHNMLSKKHKYIYSQQTLERKIQQMELKRQQEDLAKDDEEGMAIIIQCVKQIDQTPEENNVGYCKLKKILKTKYGITVHEYVLHQIFTSQICLFIY